MRKLEIVQPCDFQFDAAQLDLGGTGGRRCDACARVVTDVSAMTADEADAFLASPVKSCVRFFVDEDDHIVFREPPREAVVGRVAENARPMIVVASLLLAACGKTDAGGASSAAIRPEPAASNAAVAQPAPSAEVAVESAVPRPSSSAACDPLKLSSARPVVARRPGQKPAVQEFAGDPIE